MSVPWKGRLDGTTVYRIFCTLGGLHVRYVMDYACRVLKRVDQVPRLIKLCRIQSSSSTHIRSDKGTYQLLIAPSHSITCPSVEQHEHIQVASDTDAAGARTQLGLELG
jgi:hypothetical protein